MRKDFDMVSVTLQRSLGQALKELRQRISDTVKLVSYSNKALEQLMKEAGFDQKGFAEICGVKQQNISNYILGKTSPKEEDLRKFGKALKVIFLPDWTDEEWEKETPRYSKQQGES